VTGYFRGFERLCRGTRMRNETKTALTIVRGCPKTNV
jgi:hypothetical protein